MLNRAKRRAQAFNANTCFFMYLLLCGVVVVAAVVVVSADAVVVADAIAAAVAMMSLSL